MPIVGLLHQRRRRLGTLCSLSSCALIAVLRLPAFGQGAVDSGTGSWFGPSGGGTTVSGGIHRFRLLRGIGYEQFCYPGRRSARQYRNNFSTQCQPTGPRCLNFIHYYFRGRAWERFFWRSAV